MGRLRRKFMQSMFKKTASANLKGDKLEDRTPVSTYGFIEEDRRKGNREHHQSTWHFTCDLQQSTSGKSLFVF